MRAVFADGRVKVNTHDVRLYMRLFEKNLSFMEGCYRCQFASLDRPSDITLGDFWGIRRVMPDFPKKKGVSQILVNTEKGQELLRCLSDMARDTPGAVMEQCRGEDYRKYQHNLNRPSERPREQPRWRKDMKEKSFDYILRRYGGNNPAGMAGHCLEKIVRETGAASLLRYLKEL